MDILRGISDVLGRDTINLVIATREAAKLSRYRGAMAGGGTSHARLDKLAELSSAEGDMAGVEKDADGTLRLVEDHCQICAAANFRQGFCRAAKAVVQNALSPDVRIERDEHNVAGGRRCICVVRDGGS